MSCYDTIIIGAGPAGMTAAIYAIRANLKVLMLDKLSPGGQMLNTNEIENYTGVGAINGAELAIQMFTHTQELGVEYDERTVIGLEENNGVIKVLCEEDNAVYETKTVIVATGSLPRTLGVPGEDTFTGNGLSWCAICDGPQYRDKDVVVIGGGNSAVEESIYLAGFVKSLTIVTLFDLTADPVACDRLRSFKNVTIYPYQKVLEFQGNGKLEGVLFESTETGEQKSVSCDGIFEYIGLQPMSNIVKPFDICTQFGTISVDEHMQTTVKGIYAAGDVVDKHLRQIVTACSDGAIAAQKASKYIETL
jgi:thioredoxin reductase (NADPH)